MKIVFVRHGESQGNAEKILGGHVDFELTKTGVMEAQELGKQLSAYDFDTVITSDLKRAVHTAKEATNNFVSVKHIISPLLREIHLGEFEGIRHKDACKHFDCDLKSLYSHILRQPECETSFELFNRSIDFFNNFLIQQNYKNLLVVGHSFFMTCLMGLILREKIGKYRFGNCGWMEISLDDNLNGKVIRSKNVRLIEL